MRGRRLIENPLSIIPSWSTGKVWPTPVPNHAQQQGVDRKPGGVHSFHYNKLFPKRWIRKGWSCSVQKRRQPRKIQAPKTASGSVHWDTPPLSKTSACKRPCLRFRPTLELRRSMPAFAPGLRAHCFSENHKGWREYSFPRISNDSHLLVVFAQMSLFKAVHYPVLLLSK